MGTISSRCLVMATLGVVMGCASLHESPQPGPFAQSGTVTLRVENRHWLDVNIYLMRGGQRIRRLGTVTALGTQTFRAPANQVVHVADLYLLADPIGSRGSYRSETMMIGPGQRVDWTLANVLHRSALSIW